MLSFTRAVVVEFCKGKKKNNLSFVESSCRISLPLEFSLYVFCSACADSQLWLRLQIATPKTYTEEAIFHLFVFWGFFFLFIHWFLVSVRACVRVSVFQMAYALSPALWRCRHLYRRVQTAVCNTIIQHHDSRNSLHNNSLYTISTSAAAVS